MGIMGCNNFVNSSKRPNCDLYHHSEILTDIMSGRVIYPKARDTRSNSSKYKISVESKNGNLRISNFKSCRKI